MDRKFYVSLEAAKLLKEKGYNEEVEMFYNDIGFLREVREFFEGWECLSNDRLYNNRLSAPSKAEAIDWLESKGIVVEVYGLLYKQEGWIYRITEMKNVTEYYMGEYVSVGKFSTRLEAEDAAIIKALELLKKGE